MAVVCAKPLSYETQHFNSLPHIDEYSFEQALGYKEVAHSICDVLVKYEVNDILGAVLVHKHFKLNPQEVVVIRWRGEEVVMRSSVESDTTQHLLPYQWR